MHQKGVYTYPFPKLICTKRPRDDRGSVRRKARSSEVRGTRGTNLRSIYIPHVFHYCFLLYIIHSFILTSTCQPGKNSFTHGWVSSRANYLWAQSLLPTVWEHLCCLQGQTLIVEFQRQVGTRRNHRIQNR